MSTEPASGRARFLRTWGLAGLIALLLLIWMLSGMGAKRDDKAAAQGNAATADKTEQALFTVLAEDHKAEAVERTVRFSGDTQPEQLIQIAAQVEGEVLAFDAKEGQRLKAGAVIARIDARDLEARRTRARALVHQRELEHTAAKPLRNSGVITEADLASAVANLEGARAELRNIELQLANVQVKAPVAAILERRLVERGDFVKVGAAIATLIVNDPLLISGGVSENEIEQVRPGAAATAKLNDGRELNGVVRYVSARANEQTRTFTVEVEVDNPGAKIPAGLSAKVSIPVGSVMAHRLPSALLSLDDQGVLGVKSVNNEGRVVFHEAHIERADGDAVWLSGLPDELKIITRGQGFVQPGEQVRVTDEDAQ